MKKSIGILLSIVMCVAALFVFKYRKKIYKQGNNTMEKTLAIIKPDAVKAKNSGKIIDRIEQEGFEILGMKKIQLTKEQAQQFYAVHKERGFYGELVEFMTSGPVIVMALAKQGAVLAWRDLMGATNPAQAAEGTIRKIFATSIGENATHGSDAPETAAEEVAFFFPELK